MEEYRGIVKKRSKSTQIGFAILVLVMLILSVLRRQWFYVPFTILLIPACFLEKEQILDEEGAKTRLILFGKEFHSVLWKWEEISLISIDGRHDAINKRLHLHKEPNVRSYEVKGYEASDIAKMAKRKNPGIKVQEM